MRVATQKKTAEPRARKKSSPSGSSAPAKKSSSGDSAPIKKQAADRKPSKKSAAGKKSATTSPPSDKASASRSSGSQKAPGAGEIAQGAAAQLADLTDKDVEGVTSIERTEDGWSVELDVLELSRIPNTTDVLATYEVDLDNEGELQGYRRAHRYVRGVTGEE